MFEPTMKSWRKAGSLGFEHEEKAKTTKVANVTYFSPQHYQNPV